MIVIVPADLTVATSPATATTFVLLLTKSNGRPEELLAESLKVLSGAKVRLVRARNVMLWFSLIGSSTAVNRV